MLALYRPIQNENRMDLLMPIGRLSPAALFWKAATACQVSRTARGAWFLPDYYMDAQQAPSSLTAEQWPPAVSILRSEPQTTL